MQFAPGKRNFIIVVSEGVGSEFSPAFTEKIERETGIEARFARLAHVVRGGVPTLRDRLIATQMGERAVVELFNGNSNIVMCERKGQILATDIDYALTLDHMYKKKLKDGDLSAFSAEQVKAMEAHCAERAEAVRVMYNSIDQLGL